jgi:hypothetical protein
VTLIRIDDSEECSALIIMVTRIGKLGTLAVTSNRKTLRRTTDYTRKEAVEWDTRQMGGGMGSRNVCQPFELVPGIMLGWKGLASNVE